MADLAVSLQEAKKQGYSDKEIADYLSKDPGMGSKVAAARKEGYGDNEIVSHLAGALAPAASTRGPQKGAYGFSEPAPPPKRNDGVGWDVANSFLSGAVDAGRGMATSAFNAATGGAIDRNALELAGRVATKGVGAAVNALGGPGALPEAMLQPYQPQTEAGKVARTAGEMAPNALFPGSAASRLANVVVPAITTELAGRGAKALGANETGVNLARMAGTVAGGVGANIRVKAGAWLPVVDRAVAEVMAKQDPAAMEQRAAEFRAAGVEPTLTDVVDDAGRGVIRAAASKQTPGRQQATDYRDTTVSDTKPAVMAKAQDLTPEQRTVDQLVEHLLDRRQSQATTQYAAPYESQVSLNDGIKAALSDAPGRAALQRARTAAVARMDNARVAEIDSLLGEDLPDSVSAATLDRTKIAMGERARKASIGGANDLASGLNKRAAMIDDALDQVPGLGEARAAYRSKTEAINVLGKDARDPFSTAPTDYSAWVGSLGPEARKANAVAVRQGILDQLGGKRSGSMGDLDTLSTSQYARANLRAALGQTAADNFLGYVASRLRTVRNANDIAPRTGSQTQNKLQDAAETGRGVVSALGKVGRGDAIGAAFDGAKIWLKARGMTDAQAQRIVELSVDPKRVDVAIAQVQARYGAKRAAEFKVLLNSSTLQALNAPGSPDWRRAAPAPRPTNPTR